ncbi:MAG: 2,3-bisphosphoglycerate-independent phosphoglycerate mutase [Candidatus Margulisbacteria bacterium]|nr:2,3-bisphosphoglycerate-independent phosphoglycerate mutase [Candidatus Margulisiibacteriota bacterium]
MPIKNKIISDDKRPVLLMINDGMGLRKEKEGNAIATAFAPTLYSLFQNYPHAQLTASSRSVGLPKGIMGNSEVGHLNIGAGRIVYQDIVRIDESVENGSFFSNEAITAAMDHCQVNNSSLHVMGLISDGKVHSSLDHLYAILELAKKKKLGNVYVHAFMDGRDTPPDSGLSYLKQVMEKMKEIGIGEVATVSGRYYSMDRDKRWDRVEKSYNMLVAGDAPVAVDPLQAVEDSYKDQKTDEFINPVIINKNGIIKDNDAVIFFNYRADRAREMSEAINVEDFAGFQRKKVLNNIFYTTMTQYDLKFDFAHVAFGPQSLNNILGEVVSRAGLNQLRIAETEKYAHVTFFFNGGVEAAFPNEDRILIPSPKEVATYDLKPEMSANEVTEKLLEAIESGKYDLIILNFANCDMVGHTGFMKAAIKAVETVDYNMSLIIPKILEHDGIVLVTADHGNAEQMTGPDGKPMTAHTTGPVPIILVSKRTELQKGRIRLEDGILADISPTILQLLDLPQPPEMTGKSLIKPLN